MDVRIRIADEADAGDLARLMTELGYRTAMEEMRDRLRAILPRDDFHTLVAESEGEVIGMAGLQRSPSYERNRAVGRITAFVVAERFRGRGVGRMLAAEAEAWFRRVGAERIVVTSALHREKAHRFYEALGYVTNGVRLAKPL